MNTLHHRQAVIVDEGGPVWAAEIVRTGLWPTSPVLVVCTDPWDNRARVRGQRVVVLPREVTPAFRPGRWS